MRLVCPDCLFIVSPCRVTPFPLRESRCRTTLNSSRAEQRGTLRTINDDIVERAFSSDGQ